MPDVKTPVPATTEPTPDVPLQVPPLTGSVRVVVEPPVQSGVVPVMAPGGAFTVIVYDAEPQVLV